MFINTKKNTKESFIDYVLLFTDMPKISLKKGHINEDI